MAEKIKLAAGKKKTITYKDIMGISHKLAPTDVQKLIDEQLTRLADDVADKICELNGDKAVSAVFVVGGGGKFPGFTVSAIHWWEQDSMSSVMPQTMPWTRGVRGW